jgi:hypothetical protein
LRVLAYSAVTSLVSWVPFIGGILSLYGIYLEIVGIREVHNTTTGKAAVVVLITAVILLFLAQALIALVCLTLLRHPAVADYDTRSGDEGNTCAVSGG